MVAVLKNNTGITSISKSEYLRCLQLSSVKEHLKLWPRTSNIRLLHSCLLPKLGKIWSSGDYTYHNGHVIMRQVSILPTCYQSLG